MGHTPDVRHGYGHMLLPQPYKGQMTGQIWSLVTALQFLLVLLCPGTTPHKCKEEDPKMKPILGRKAAAVVKHKTPN